MLGYFPTGCVMTIGKVDRRSASLKEMAYVRLRAAIVEGRLRPGDVLVEDQLAADLDISRTPLRESLAKLEQEGLVESIPYRGTFVASISVAQVAHIQQVRLPLELMAMDLAIEEMPLSEIERVISFIEQRRSLLAQGNPALHMECNRLFHELAPRYCGNPVLEQIIQNLERRIAIYLMSTGQADTVMAADEHLRMLDAYGSRDRLRAAKLIRWHLRGPAADGNLPAQGGLLPTTDPKEV
jgi:DNA-binding GntR family transcriptional regulator